jgi:hypothetical protein
MGTRGAFGFRIGGVDKITYNHYDSYPDGLGDHVAKDLVAALVEDSFGDMKRKAAALRLVSRDDTPTADDIAACKAAGTIDTGVSKQSLGDWYCLLRKAAPSSAGIWPLLDVGVMIDSHDFLADSLFCEFGYIVNLDEMTFEVYRGSQRAAHEKGRYAAMPVEARHVDTYWPVALVGTYQLADAAKWQSTWIVETFSPDEDDE